GGIPETGSAAAGVGSVAAGALATVVVETVAPDSPRFVFWGSAPHPKKRKIPPTTTTGTMVIMTRVFIGLLPFCKICDQSTTKTTNDPERPGVRLPLARPIRVGIRPFWQVHLASFESLRRVFVALLR